MENANNFRIVQVTTSSYENALHIARILVSEQLAACCNILTNCFSVYGWMGAIEENMEVLLVIKTIDEKMDLLEARVLELHPYDVPEILSLPISSASKHYLEWLRQGLAS